MPNAAETVEAQYTAAERITFLPQPVSASLNDSRNIPRWLRKRVLNLERIEPNEYYVFKGKRYEYRVSFTVNQGHSRVLARARRK